MTKYPDLNDNDFYKFIKEKYSKFEIPKSKKSINDFCFPKKYQLQLPQKFLSEFINPDTPYRGLLVYHQIGSGKTCTAISIAENFKGKKKILIVVPASLKGNFRKELRSQCADDTYLTSEERKLLDILKPSSEEYQNIIAKSDARIDKYYNIYSYHKFVNLINKKEIELNNSLLIIDEVQNMISETGVFYETLYNFIHKTPSNANNRIVILTATPIFDKPVEIALTMNLILRGKQLPTGQDFINTFMDIKYTDKGIEYSTKNLNLFKEYVRGYVSYFRGAPPYVFPKKEIIMENVKMSDIQVNAYKQIFHEESKRKLTDYVNKDISNNFYIGSRAASNIVYPNGTIRKKGFESLAEHDLKESEIIKYAPKFLKILKKIKKCNGPIFVYSNFKNYGGLKPFIMLLEYHSFKNYTTDGEGDNRYAILSGDQDIVIKDEIVNVFNKKENMDGSKLKVILGTIREGISLLRVKEVHVMDPSWNYSRLDQIIGRAIRFCSHKDLPEKERAVKVYIYLADHPNIKLSVDKYMMDVSLTKERIKNSFLRALKESAIDCQLFYNANVYPGEEKIMCVT
jgi:hypothetical protein